MDKLGLTANEIADILEEFAPNIDPYIKVAIKAIVVANNECILKDIDKITKQDS